MNDTLFIVGQGISAPLFTWPDGIDMLCVSGGINSPPFLPQFWCGIDPPHCYGHLPWFLQSDVRKFVLATNFLRRWSSYSNVTMVPFGGIGKPNFGPDGPLCEPPGTHANSLFPAIQVGHRLGYRRLAFVGVDLLEPEFDTMAEALESWYHIATSQGLEWVTASDVSRLFEFMPLGEAEHAMMLTEQGANA